jgi:(2R)-3-sulfolactate dehydrogenase (NADP+)
LVGLIAAEAGTHLPGSGRRAARAKAMRDGVMIDPAILAKAKALAGESV